MKDLSNYIPELWFDVEIGYYTTQFDTFVGRFGLWFDVEIGYYTTLHRVVGVIKRCDLM